MGFGGKQDHVYKYPKDEILRNYRNYANDFRSNSRPKKSYVSYFFLFN